METADVVIVGAGVVGASVAWHLAQRRAGRVIVLDRGDRPGAGSTSRATGGFRVQFGSPVNVKLSILSREKLLRFAEDTGGDAGFVPAGYLFVASSEQEMTALREAVEVQRREGWDRARIVSSDEVRDINPHIGEDDLAGGCFGPDDGFIRPMQILEGYRTAAERAGVEFRFGCEVTSVTMDGARVGAVRTEGGTRITADAFVNAAGPWAADFAAACGVPLPVTRLRRCVLPTMPTSALPADMPMTIFTSDGFHLRVRDGRALLLWPDEPADAGSTQVEDCWIDAVTDKARSRIPALREVPLDPAAAWAGLYEMSPDRHVILGAAPGVENLFLANGSSGHGVMHAPAIGQLLAERIVDGAFATIDVTALRPERFGEGDPVKGSSLL